MSAGGISGGFSGEFGWFKYKQSEIIYQNAIPVVTAKPVFTVVGNASVYLSNDNGESWELVTSGVLHTFASSSSDDKVLWKAVGSPGSELTYIEVEINAIS